jgi:transposase
LDLPLWAQQTLGWILQTVPRPVGVTGFVVLPKRWIVERTFARLACHRRRSKDHETTGASEAMIDIGIISVMSKKAGKPSKLKLKTRS